MAKVITLYDFDPMIALNSAHAEDDCALEPFGVESPSSPGVISLWHGGMLHILDQAMYLVHPIF